VNTESPTRAKPARRRWRGVALGTATVVVLGGGGWATASAATTKAKSGGQPKQTFKVIKGRTGVPAVVEAANEFLALLTDDQKAEVLQDFTSANATEWSNLPTGIAARPGIELGELTDTQLAAAKQVVQLATGTGKGTGYDQITKILEADDVLAAAQGSSGASADPSGTATATEAPSAAASATDAPSAAASATDTSSAAASATDTSSADPSASAAPSGSVDPSAGAPGGAPPSGGTGGAGGLSYGSGLYFLAFLGTPSTTGTWQLHFGGHHLALNLTYKDGKVEGTTPFFIGIEPTSFTDSDGNTVEALKPEHDAMLALAQSLTSTQLTTAKVSESFSDVLLGPGQDGNFPSTKEGIKVSALSPQQKKLVLAAIHPWVASVADADAARIAKQYAAQLNQTYVAVSGNQTLTGQGDYVRIDGPGVWIEFVCQNGIVFPGEIHFHTVYRDHNTDYGGEFSF
jgi:hypothetical protein